MRSVELSIRADDKLNPKSIIDKRDACLSCTQMHISYDKIHSHSHQLNGLTTEACQRIAGADGQKSG
jgi:hypothetical protein